MSGLGAGVLAGIAGKLGEFKTPKDSGSPQFRLRQAIREYNALLDRTDPTAPATSPTAECISSEKAVRRRNRHNLIRRAQSNAASESNPAKRRQLLATADRLKQDMDRVEDAKLSLHTYTANEDPDKQQDFLKPLRDQAPPGFKMASLDQVANDFGVEREQLEGFVNKGNSTQKIMIYERDVEVLGPGPKYTIAFRGSTSDPSDWNNNGRNEMGFEATHQKNAAQLGSYLAAGAAKKGKPIDALVSATGHSKGGSEAQAFAATSGCSARVYNPAGFSPRQYEETQAIKEENMRVDVTSVVERRVDGTVIRSTPTTPHTDPLYYAQNSGLSSFVMKKPVTAGSRRELLPVDPNLSVPSAEQAETESHSMLQVIEGLERDKRSDQNKLEEFVVRQ